MNEGFTTESKNLHVLSSAFFDEKKGENFPTIYFYCVKLFYVSIFLLVLPHKIYEQK